MRKIIVVSHLTLDGVIQSPGTAEEDTSGGFTQGGWLSLFGDDVLRSVLRAQMNMPFDLLLGRKTFEIWENYWPTHSNFWPNVMTATKYVASNTRDSSDWHPNVFLSGDLAEKVRELKQTDGPDIQAFGSADMLQTLFKADLVDRLELMIIPVTLGQGKRLFQHGTIPAAFKVTSSQVAPKGIICATYERDGDVKGGDPQIE